MTKGIALPFGISDRDLARFWTHANPREDGCWIWTGPLKPNGYGYLVVWRNNASRAVYAHRISYALHFGEPKQQVLHRCDTPACVRPECLFDGSQQDNVDDAIAKGRAVAPPVHHGMANPKATRPDSIVAQVRARAGEDQRALAAEFGVSQSTIWRWLRREVRA